MFDVYKNTITGQVLEQVGKARKNSKYLDKIDDLLDDIYYDIYRDANMVAWDKFGLVILDNMDNIVKNPEYIYFVTDYVSEYSWLINSLVVIYSPKIVDLNRLMVTLGYLITIYSKRYKKISMVFKIVAILSTVFLHPDHLGEDRFLVQPASLPDFGKEF